MIISKIIFVIIRQLIINEYKISIFDRYCKSFYLKQKYLIYYWNSHDY